jgi:hypothetical protein
MLVRVSRVRAGGELLAHTTVLRVGDELHRGLKPLIGVNLVAGVTGSGKTLLAEALWLGVAHALSALLGEQQFRDALVAASEAYGIRPIDMEFEACLSDVEVPGLRGKTCIEVDVCGGVESWTAVPDDVMGNEKLRRSLVYALMHTISVPDKVKWRAAYALRELRRMGLLELAPEDGLQELCLATAALVPPAAYEREGRTYVPCYVRMLGLGRLPHATASHGEVSYALFEAAYETAYRISKLAREELGVSMIPVVYIDDALEGLDARRMKSLLSRDYGDASIYATTHRIEAGMYSARNLLLTYGTKASELVEQPSSFRFALVDAALVESRKEIYEDVSSKLLLDE